MHAMNPTELYLDLMKRCLSFSIWGEVPRQVGMNELSTASGEYLIVNDCGYLEFCRQAVHDYRNTHGITETIHQIDWTGIYWRRAES